jgi:hypothetical protein
MSAVDLREHLTDVDGRLTARLARVAQATFTQVARNAACNRVHTVRQRAARWLLMTADRMDSPSFGLAQHFLAQMLAVRRTSVSEVAQSPGRGRLHRLHPRHHHDHRPAAPAVPRLQLLRGDPPDHRRGDGAPVTAEEPVAGHGAPGHHSTLRVPRLDRHLRAGRSRCLRTASSPMQSLARHAGAELLAGRWRNSITAQGDPGMNLHRSS